MYSLCRSTPFPFTTIYAARAQCLHAVGLLHPRVRPFIHTPYVPYTCSSTSLFSTKTIYMPSMQFMLGVSTALSYTAMYTPRTWHMHTPQVMYACRSTLLRLKVRPCTHPVGHVCLLYRTRTHLYVHLYRTSCMLCVRLLNSPAQPCTHPVRNVCLV